jgi:glycosyltransferase involved in cell wall biosynthesis
MKKLIIIPGICDALGGTLVTLSLLIKGFEDFNQQESLCILVRSGSVMENYLHQSGQKDCLYSIEAPNQPTFMKKALQWVEAQSVDYPLLLDNCVDKSLQMPLLLSTFKLHLSGRRIYHFCHDLALSYDYRLKISYSYWGYLLKKFTFTLLSAKGICNSQFTANHISQTIHDISGILYQPVDPNFFSNLTNVIPPVNLLPIIESGSKIILTVSRISKPGIQNDKNLIALISVIAYLKTKGHSYHSVIVGQDLSMNKTYTRQLLEAAKHAGVAERFTILPPTFAIADYYKHADVVVSLAPREPFGRTIVEAIASGVPVVGSNTGGIGEILGHFAPEWMVDPNDPVATAEAIINVFNSSNTSQILAKAKFWVEKNCSVSQYAKRMMEITGCINIDKEKKMESYCINSVN